MSQTGQENSNAQIEGSSAHLSTSGRPDIRLPLQSLGEASMDYTDRQSISFDDRLEAEESDAASTKEVASTAVSHFAFQRAPASEASKAGSSGLVQGTPQQLLSSFQEFAPVKEPVNSPTRYK